MVTNPAIPSPPSINSFSISVTFAPYLVTASEADIPANPPPATTQSQFAIIGVSIFFSDDIRHTIVPPKLNIPLIKNLFEPGFRANSTTFFEEKEPLYFSF